MIVRWQRAFINLYPYLSSASHVLRIAYYIAYMYELTKYPSLDMHILRFEIHRMTMDDLVATQSQKSVLGKRWSFSWVLSLFFRNPFRILLDSLQSFLPLALFFL